MILFLNACVRERSRTKRLADALLARLPGPVEEVRLWEEAYPVADEAFLDEWYQRLETGAQSDPMFERARQFARADGIVLAAPYWDLSFPAVVKQYFQWVSALGITFEYTPDGRPRGLCRARRLYYVTTAGGLYVPEAFGFGYVRALAEEFYGIPEVAQLRAVGLDIDGADPERIMNDALAEIPRIVGKEKA